LKEVVMGTQSKRRAATAVLEAGDLALLREAVKSFRDKQAAFGVAQNEFAEAAAALSFLDRQFSKKYGYDTAATNINVETGAIERAKQGGK
jgi:hypothetical protein